MYVFTEEFSHFFFVDDVTYMYVEALELGSGSLSCGNTSCYDEVWLGESLIVEEGRYGNRIHGYLVLVVADDLECFGVEYLTYQCM